MEIRSNKWFVNVKNHTLVAELLDCLDPNEHAKVTMHSASQDVNKNWLAGYYEVELFNEHGAYMEVGDDLIAVKEILVGGAEESKENSGEKDASNTEKSGCHPGSIQTPLCYPGSIYKTLEKVKRYQTKINGTLCTWAGHLSSAEVNLLINTGMIDWFRKDLGNYVRITDVGNYILVNYASQLQYNETLRNLNATNTQDTGNAVQ